ncbi:MAG: hypothetical protein NVS2B16_19980 [Chloroflexota bacterium]
MMACVAVIEDEPDLLLLLRDALELHGHEVIPLAHHYVLDASLAGARPDLFVIDMMLGTQNGIEIAQALRASGFADIPMLAMSASSAMIQSAQQSGCFQAVLAKPFDVDELVTIVRQHARSAAFRKTRQIRRVAGLTQARPLRSPARDREVTDHGEVS